MTSTATLNKKLVIRSEMEFGDTWRNKAPIGIFPRYLSGTNEFQHILNLRSTTSMEDQLWFWTPEWQEGEREATREIQSEELSPLLNSMDEITKFLSSS